MNTQDQNNRQLNIKIFKINVKIYKILTYQVVFNKFQIKLKFQTLFKIIKEQQHYVKVDILKLQYKKYYLSKL